MSQFWRKSKVKPIETNDLSNHRRHLDIFRNMRNGNICLFRMVAFLLMAATCSIRIAVIILVYGLLLGGMPLGDFVLCTHSVLSWLRSGRVHFFASCDYRTYSPRLRLLWRTSSATCYYHQFRLGFEGQLSTNALKQLPLNMGKNFAEHCAREDIESRFQYWVGIFDNLFTS